MSKPAAQGASEADRPAVAELRAAYRAAGTAAGLTLLAFAAELALETIPAGPGLETGFAAVDLAARVGAGEDIDPWALCEAYHDDHDEGLEPTCWTYRGSPHERAWLPALCVVGAASWRLSAHRGEPPYSLFEDFDDPDAREQACDALNEIDGLDDAALSAACAHVRAHGSKAADGWGQPLRIEALYRAAGRRRQSAEDFLSRIQGEQRETEGCVRPPATDAAIMALCAYAARVGLALPEGYLAFLRRCDGLDFNGFTIYGATTRTVPYLPSFETANTLYAADGLALYGETGDELFGQDRASGAWRAFDRPSLSPLETFDSFNALLEHALKAACEG